MKRAVVISPYWDTLGGGEKYLARTAKVFHDCGYFTEVWWNDEQLPYDLEERFGFDPAFSVNVSAFRRYQQATFFNKWQMMRNYDLIFALTDGSLPWLWAKQNIIHFQVPFTHVGGTHFINVIKKMLIKRFICNSSFTKGFIDSEFGVKSDVVYPPVHLYAPRPKKNYILSVGRFNGHLHAKRQDVLIEAFRTINMRGWELILAGGLQGSEEVIKPLRAKADNYPIRFVINPDYHTMEKLYGEAMVYWHAAGYGTDLLKEPEKAEHFGISTVEAMSAGAVPVVFAGGGQREIVEHGINGLWWENLEKLVLHTSDLINNHQLWMNMSQQAKSRANLFSEEVFDESIKAIIS